MIFDLDGTLVDSVADIAARCNAALHGEGLPCLSVERIRGFVGGGLGRLAALAVAAAGDGPEAPSVPALVARVHARIEQLSLTDAVDQTRPFPGTVVTLQRLQRRGVAMAVLSNKLHAASLQVVATLFPAVRFLAVQGFDTDAFAKPDPRHALAIARALRTRPQQVALVGDGEHDMQCARRAGMQALGATWGYRTPRQLLRSGAQRLISHPLEVARLLAPS